MNKKLFSVLILFSFVAQSAHAYFGWVSRPAKFVSDGASDIFQVLKPELRTGSKFVPKYKKGSDGQPGKFEHAHYVKKVGEKNEPHVVEFSDLEVAVEAMADSRVKEEYQSRLQVFKEAKRAGKAKKALGSFDFDGMPYGVDLNGAVFCLSEEGRLREADPGLQCLGPIGGNGPPAYVLHICSKFLREIRSVTHEEQTEEKKSNMRFDFFRSLRGFKRDTKLLGCYVFMKPYALACAAGLAFGAYKLYEKLEIYEKFLKPNTHGLKEDELDSSL